MNGRRPARAALALALLAYACAPDEPPAGDPSAAAPDTGRTTLASGPGGGTRTLRLVIGACDSAGCALEVRLDDGSRALDVETLEWTMPSTDAARGAVGSTAGVGDPLEARAMAWHAGEEERSTTVAGTPVALAPDAPALLIDLSAGFDHPKRRHELWIAEADSLRRVWLGTEPQGPAWTTVAVRRSPGSSVDTLVYFDGYEGSDGRPDSVRVTRLAWQANARAIVAADDVAAYAVVVGPFSSVAEAAATRDGAPECLGSYWVLSAAAVGAGGADRTALAVLTSSEALASAEVERLAGCAGVPRAAHIRIPRQG